MNYNILGFTTFEPNAKHIKYIISLNKNYINSNKYFYISEIIPHEMAHIICFENKLINVSLHNNDWKNLCIIMGGSGQKILNFNGEEKCYMR
jgi:predicted SprT family Zn-dependent metalloprotease